MLSIPPCCPISKNPLSGSMVTIEYTPAETIIEVASLRSYVDSYQGGRGEIRSMEGMIQNIAQDCADCVKRSVHVRAKLILNPNQEMAISCAASPR